jgi:hypothetical protein
MLIDSSHLRRPSNWSSIWKLKVPPKIRNLIWRMCRGCLPTRMRLQDKGVQCPMHCVSCDSGQEDMAHLFFHSSFAIQVWRFAGLWSHIQNVIATAAPVTDMIFNLLKTLPTEQKQTLAAMVWTIWKHRNLKVWEDKTETAATAVERARAMISDWQLANLSLPAADSAVTTVSSAHLSPNAATSSSPAAAMVRWKKPGVGRYKCNVDAAFSSSFNHMGIGICIRDEEGTFILGEFPLSTLGCGW